jgi:hypothetical protein
MDRFRVDRTNDCDYNGSSLTKRAFSSFYLYPNAFREDRDSQSVALED